MRVSRLLRFEKSSETAPVLSIKCSYCIILSSTYALHRSAPDHNACPIQPLSSSDTPFRARARNLIAAATNFSCERRGICSAAPQGYRSLLPIRLTGFQFSRLPVWGDLGISELYLIVTSFPPPYPSRVHPNDPNLA